MIEDFEYKGKWWLPDEPTEKISGTLRYSHNDGATLELIGSLKIIQQLINDEKYLVILGESYDGKDISLHGCFLISSHGSYPNYSITSYFVETVFLGIHFHDLEDVKFKSIHVCYSHLDEWINISGLKSTHIDDELVIKCKMINDIEVHLDNNYNIIIRNIVHSGQSKVPNKAYLESKWIVGIEAEYKSSLESFNTVIQHLQHFLYLAIREPVYVLSMEGYSELAENIDIDIYSPIGIFYRAPFIMRSPKYVTDMLFKYKEVSDDLEILLNNWFKNEDILRPVYGLYFGTLYNYYLYPENQFLNMIHTVEAFHEHIYGNGKKLDLRIRLTKLLNECGEKVVPQLLGNRDIFIDNVINTRNYHTHHDPKKYKKAILGMDLIPYVKKLNIVIEVFLITHIIGISSEKAQVFFSKHREILGESWGQFLKFKK